MSDTHTTTFCGVDLEVTVNDDGDVLIQLQPSEAKTARTPVRMEWDTFREVIDFVCVHGLLMTEPYVVEYRDTREAIEA